MFLTCHLQVSCRGSAPKKRRQAVQEVFALYSFAGLWSHNKVLFGITSCTIITAAAAESNPDEQRQLRASLCRPLISLPKDARAGVVDLIMANVLGK